MKNMKKILILIVLFSGFAASSFAQATGTASASATIIAPISIAKTADMNFGNIAVNATPGTVILATAGTRTKTGGVTLPATAGTVTAAQFTVTGANATTYAITLPTSITISHLTDYMYVDTFTSNPSSPGLTDGNGTQIIFVGATLTVGASQAAGVYGPGSFPVTVNYN